MMINRSVAKKNDSPGQKPAAVVPQTTTTVETTINASWTWANPVFKAYNGYSSYYDVFTIVASTANQYTFSSRSAVGTYGYLYLPSFNKSLPEQNLINYGQSWETNGQFQFTNYLDSGVTYYLVVATSRYLDIGKYQLVITGTNRVTLKRITVLEPAMSNISVDSAFTNLQPVFQESCRGSSFYSYDIFLIVPLKSDNYTVEVVTEFGSTIQMFTPKFDPLATKYNLLAMIESNGYNSYLRMNVPLVASNQYYLVLSSFTYYQVQRYRLTFRSLSKFNMTKLTNNFISTINTPSSLTKTSPRYSQGYGGTNSYYYKIFHISVPQLGIYSFIGYSNISLIGYFYEISVSPMLYYSNMIFRDYYSDPEAKLVVKAKLTPAMNYYLLVTTPYPNTTGAFYLTAVGPKPFHMTAVPDSSTSTVTLSSSLTSRSSRFSRCDLYYGNFYYRLFNISVPSLGLYTIKTVGLMDTFGCLYRNQFDPTNSRDNLFSFDDQSGGNNQFAIITVLHPNTIYYLASSTNREDSVGSFKVTASGPAKMTIVAADSA